jgi:uridine kinase
MNGEKHSPVVIAISGVSGGGKTTTVKHLNERLHNSKTLFFDDYDFDGPSDIIDWVDKGANYNEWKLEPLIKDIETLIAEPIEYLIIDFPFAYKHSKTSPFIDLTVFIDTPLDIAMARRIIRDFKGFSNQSILNEMANYIQQGRRGYLEMLKTVKPNSDIVIDGTQTVTGIVDNLYEVIVSKTTVS